jgi:putative ATPase
MKAEMLHGAGFSVQAIKKIVDDATYHPTLLFIDEVHRLSSSQQDHLLDHAERGTFDLLAATSVNPYHNLSNALRSRATIFELRPLTREDEFIVLSRGLKTLKDNGVECQFQETAALRFIEKCGGDGRRLLTALEGIVIGRGNRIEVTESMVDEALASTPVSFDRSGDDHYDMISAFVKSMRGGDPDATLYWLAALLHAGEDPLYIARRMMIHASEDVALADNSALQTAITCIDAVERIGMPEGRIVLAHAALHICRSPKSNSAYRGINLAMDYIKKNNIMPVPNHLRDTHYEGAAPMGRGGYSSPHSTAEGWLEQVYAPGIKPGAFYQSDARAASTFEARSDQYWEKLKKEPQPKKWAGE